MSLVPYSDDDSVSRESVESNDNEFADPYEYGQVVTKLTSGRHSKLEGSLYGAVEMAGLTCHTKFLAANNASDGYVSLQRGTWVVPPAGIPWNAMQVARIISGEVANQRKFVVVLLNPLGVSANRLQDRISQKELCIHTLILHGKARCRYCLDMSQSEWADYVSQPWYYVPLKKLQQM